MQDSLLYIYCTALHLITIGNIDVAVYLTGATVVMACRHMGKCEKVATSIRQSTENFNVVCRFVDLASLDSIEEFSSSLSSGEYKRSVILPHGPDNFAEAQLYKSIDRILFS